MKSIPAGHMPVFHVEIDKTKGSPDSNKLEASLKGGKIVYSRGKSPLQQSFFSKVKKFFSSSKTNAAKEHAQTIMGPVLIKAGLSHNKITTFNEQAFNKKNAMEANFFMNIMDCSVPGDYHIPYGSGNARVVVSIKDRSEN